MKSIALRSVQIEKYKSYETEQGFAVDENVTVLVGKNESGKTAVLEAIAKTRYFEDDSKFKFSATNDYPRREKKKYDKSGEIAKVVTCSYTISRGLIQHLSVDVGPKTIISPNFSIASDYNNKSTILGFECDVESFLEFFSDKYSIKDPAEKASLLTLTSLAKLKQFQTAEEQVYVKRQSEETAKANAAGSQAKTIVKPRLLEILPKLAPYLENETNGWHGIDHYIYFKYISPSLPKFLYYDEYYALPSRIDIEELNSGTQATEAQKTSKALFELADINIKELTAASSFESYISELEATGNHITDELFKYWKTNGQLRVRFQMDRKQVGGGTHNILDIRVENLKHAMSLPLGKRSKGFNWFFSFIVWFNKIQADKNANYVLLLDEPGLNLHAAAQADLLRFIENLSERHQIIYSTHSPFMVDSANLHRVRTFFDGDTGSTISESMLQKDSDTLFPLQAALGYDIAQNLFISKNNLLVEGPADLIYLTVMSSVLAAENRVFLKSGITIVPVGGLDKVATFIALLKASKLNIVCLLDTFTNQAGKQRVEDLVRAKIIKEKNVRFFNEFASVKDEAEIEDMFDKTEYIRLFNKTFEPTKHIQITDIVELNKRIVPQITLLSGKEHFNHFRPASELAKEGLSANQYNPATLDRFEAMFKAINELF